MNAKGKVVPLDGTPTIFLDIDGVMRPLAEGRGDATSDWLESAVTTLKMVVKTKEANIVLSTSWRLSAAEPVRKHLKQCGLPEPVGSTASLSAREDEILQYVEMHCLSTWLALDDAQLDLPPAHFWRVDHEACLSLDDAPEILSRLQPSQ
eukprot:gene6786-10404_t